MIKLKSLAIKRGIFLINFVINDILKFVRRIYLSFDSIVNIRSAIDLRL